MRGTGILKVEIDFDHATLDIALTVGAEVVVGVMCLRQVRQERGRDDGRDGVFAAHGHIVLAIDGVCGEEQQELDEEAEQRE